MFYSKFENESYIEVNSDKLDELYEICRGSLNNFKLSPFFGYKRSSLKPFLKFKSVTKGLSLSNEICDDLYLLNEFSHLEVLGVGDIGKKVRIDLDNYVKLRKLMITWSERLFLHKRFENLIFLSLSKLNSQEKNLKNFLKAPNLAQLSVVSGNLKTLDGIDDLENVEELSFSYFPNLKKISEKRISLKKLTYLEFQNAGKLNFDPSIDLFENAHTLIVKKCGEIDYLENLLMVFPNLKKLDFYGTTIKSGDLSCLDGRNILVNFDERLAYNRKQNEIK